MTATNFMRAICDELMNDAHKNEMDDIGRLGVPLGTWDVSSNMTSDDGVRFITAEKKGMAGTYAITSRIIIRKRVAVETYVCHLCRVGNSWTTDYYNIIETEITDNNADEIRRFVDRLIMKEAEREEAEKKAAEEKAAAKKE